MILEISDRFKYYMKNTRSGSGYFPEILLKYQILNKMC